jgi:hypothetical protein
MFTRARNTKLLANAAMVTAVLAALAFQVNGRQRNDFRPSVAVKTTPAKIADSAADSSTSDVAKALKAAAEAVGLARWSGVGGQHLPEVDVVNTMELWASGTSYGLGQPYKPGEPWPAFNTEFHVALGYNPPAMRLEMTCTNIGASGQAGAAPVHIIQVLRENYAWDESEIGAGLVPGKGTATPAMAAANNRLLRLWILPYGVIKAALAAGDKTKVSSDNGATVLTFPLGGQLADVMVKATLDAQNLVARVDTRTDNPAHSAMLTETEYSDYADHGEIATDIKSPGHIVHKQGGHPVLDIHVKMWDANNPYLVFPVPENVKKAAAH